MALYIGAYDEKTDTIVIEGTKFSGVLFREGFGADVVNKEFRVIRSAPDGTLSIQDISGELEALRSALRELWKCQDPDEWDEAFSREVSAMCAT